MDLIFCKSISGDDSEWLWLGFLIEAFATIVLVIPPKTGVYMLHPFRSAKFPCFTPAKSCSPYNEFHFIFGDENQSARLRYGQPPRL